MHKDTIIAPATPSGVGGLAVIRLSGPAAEPCLLEYFQPFKPIPFLDSHRFYLGHLAAKGGRLVDEVMVVVMRAPHSFTREDVVEIHCHGGPAVVRSILDLFLSRKIRLARPGEFTQRAFLNGRLDLSQAEAVADLVHARTEGAARIALGQLQGRLGRLVCGFRQQLIEVLSLIEVHIDFSDQDVDLPELQPLEEQVSKLKEQIETLLGSFDAGRMLHEGIRILILGKPNVGKSSLLNALLGESRAIVADGPGTTRDTIEENLVFHDIPVRLIDTAGIRHTNDPVELEGVRRAKEKATSADLILLVVDGSKPLDEDDFLAFSVCDRERLLLVCNKADVGSWPLPDEFAEIGRSEVSALGGQGLSQLQGLIKDMLFDSRVSSGEDVMLYERRHKESLDDACLALGRFIGGVFHQLEPEFLALELREAIQSLGQVSGESVTEEVLDQIFAKFCIGK